MKIKINPEVQKALDNNQPIVALESTIISHGMPYPDNIEMAKEVEKIIRDEGAVPATIAIIDGIPTIGLTNEEIEALAKEKNVLKTSKRDIGYVVSQKMTGATTVSTTMIFSNLAGIKVFATGGIGGAHRGAELNFDISRDLEELSEVNVCVVSAGVKAILDLSLTMEILETKGVEVIGYNTDYLPGFYSKETNLKLAHRLDNPKDIAKLMISKWQFIKGGILVTNPIPKNYSLDHETIDSIIKQAIEDAKLLNIEGKEVTPYLLKRVTELTEGKSLKSNVELVKNNAKLAAMIAIEYKNQEVEKK